MALLGQRARQKPPPSPAHTRKFGSDYVQVLPTVAASGG